MLLTCLLAYSALLNLTFLLICLPSQPCLARLPACPPPSPAPLSPACLLVCSFAY